MDPIQEAERKLRFLEGRGVRIEDGVIRDEVLHLYSVLLRETQTHLDEPWKKTPHTIVYDMTMAFRVHVAILLGEEQMLSLLGDTDKLDDLFSAVKWNECQ